MNNQDFNPGQVSQAANPYEDQQYADLAYSDPRYMAFKRAQGASDQVARAEAAQAISSARQGQNNLPQEYADLLGQGLRQISDRFENQGMYSSSNRLRSQNEQQGQLEGQMLGQRNAFQDQINSANIGLQRQIAEGQMNNADQMINASDRMAQEGAQYGMNVLPASTLNRTTSRLGIR